MYLETLATIALLWAIIAAHWVRKQWGLFPFHLLLGAGLFASISGAIVPEDNLSGIGFSSTVLAGLLLVLFLDGPMAFRQTLSGIALMALIATLIRWSASTLPTPPSMFGTLEESLRIIGIGSLVFVVKAALIQITYRLMYPKQPTLAALLALWTLTLADIVWADRVGMGFSAWSVCLIHFGLSAPLVVWYLQRGWLEQKKRPKVPVPPAHLSLLKSLEHQLHYDSLAALTELLGTIHHALPQAEALSLCVRVGDQFRIVAQWGHQDELLGVEFNLGNFMIWHGDPQSWERGEARMVGGKAFRQLTRLADSALDNQTTQRLHETEKHHLIRSNLGVPILDNGSVIGYLNLDCFSSDMAFCKNSADQLPPYLNTIGLVIQTRQQQATQLALQLLTDTVFTLHRHLRNSTSYSQTLELMLDITMTAFQAQHGMISLVSLDGFMLESGLTRGFFEDIASVSVPEGVGIGWSALESGKIIRSNDVKNDLRAIDPKHSLRPSTAQLTVPLYHTQGNPLGVLYLSRDHPRMFDEVEVEIMASITDVASVFLSRWSETSPSTQPTEPVLV